MEGGPGKKDYHNGTTGMFNGSEKQKKEKRKPRSAVATGKPN